MSCIDRTNVALAKTHLATDVGIGAAAFGFGAGVFFISYAFLEIPSNLLMYRAGPRRWIARIAVTWGALSAVMMFVRGPDRRSTSCGSCSARPRPGCSPP